MTVRKAIPEARDRLQSRMLVWVAVPVLCYLTVWMTRYILVAGSRGRTYFFSAFTLSLFFALAAWRVGAATPLAAAFGGLICLQITVLSGWLEGGSPFHSGLAPLILLFALTFEATRLGREKKEAAGLAEDRTGRNSAQIIANLGIAAASSAFYYYSNMGRLPHSWQGPFILAVFEVPMLAALAEATADTVSSEIGQTFGGRPFLFPTFRRVQPGTDGAISVVGTLGGILSAVLVVASGAPALGMDFDGCAVALGAAILGLSFDTLLGATPERKGWINNDLVNFLSTAFAVVACILIMDYFHYWTFA